MIEWTRVLRAVSSAARKNEHDDATRAAALHEDRVRWSELTRDLQYAESAIRRHMQTISPPTERDI